MELKIYILDYGGEMHTVRFETGKILKKINAMGIREQQESAKRKNYLAEALSLFHELATKKEFLRDRILSITRSDSGIRCAIPTDEVIDQGISCNQSGPPRLTIVAGDASQYSSDEDEDESMEFRVLNIGLFRWLSDGHTTEEIAISELLHHEDLYGDDEWPMEDGLFRLMRDSEERIALINQSMTETTPMVALIDGSLELFKVPGNAKKSKEFTDRYLISLKKMSGTNCALAGYIDRPRANLVVRMLELATLGEDQFQEARCIRPFGRLRDAAIFRRILQPGERSAIFGIRSTSNKMYKGDIAPYFFYLNIAPFGNPKLSRIARLEIPFWVAKTPFLVNILQNAVLYQNKLLGSKPYPYCLFRAHETGLLTRQFGEELTQLVLREYYSRGIEIEEPSYKSQLKRLIE
jgi:hypothetical protein